MGSLEVNFDGKVEAAIPLLTHSVRGTLEDSLGLSEGLMQNKHNLLNELLQPDSICTLDINLPVVCEHLSCALLSDSRAVAQLQRHHNILL